MSTEVNNTVKAAPQTCRSFCNRCRAFCVVAVYGRVRRWRAGKRRSRGRGLTNDERAVTDQPSVAPRADFAKPWPDIPGVASWRELVLLAAEAPCAVQLQSGAHRPGAEKLVISEQLHVVVAGPPHRRPTQQRRRADARTVD